jgi:hypothetical protein
MFSSFRQRGVKDRRNRWCSSYTFPPALLSTSSLTMLGVLVWGIYTLKERKKNDKVWWKRKFDLPKTFPTSWASLWVGFSIYQEK